MEREPVSDDFPDRLAGDDSPARTSLSAQHEDELSPSKDLRERVGNTTPVGGPVTSPPEP